jgi:hypothetical protein
LWAPLCEARGRFDLARLLTDTQPASR